MQYILDGGTCSKKSEDLQEHLYGEELMEHTFWQMGQVGSQICVFELAADASQSALALYSFAEQDGNKEPNLIRFIVLPQFLHLKQLNLKNNKITSISSFSLLQAPQLEELLLGDNYITHIKEMRKMNCPNLAVLSLYANRICELQSFQTTSFNKLQVIIFGLNCISNVKSLNKCTWPRMKKISIENNRKVGNHLTRWDSRPEIVYG